MQSLACNVFLSDQTLEFDAVGVVPGHGFHPWKARRPRSIPTHDPVHRQGRTPPPGAIASATNGQTPTHVEKIPRRRSTGSTGPPPSDRNSPAISSVGNGGWPGLSV